jgi:hypothetical protein
MEQGGTTVAIPQRGQNFCHEPVVSGVIQRWETNTWPGITQAGEFDTEIRDTRRPRLFNDGSRFRNIKDRPLLFPTNPVWFRRGSYADPLVGDVRRLAPLVEWSDPPVGRPGAGGERMPRDEQRQHPKQSRMRFQESSQPDDEAQQSEGGTQREGSPRSSDEMDLHSVIGNIRRKRGSPAGDQPRTWGRREPSPRGTDQNEHRTRRHKYDTDLPPNGRRKRAPHGLIGDDQHHKQRLRWPSQTHRGSPTFEGVWQDGRTSSRGSKKTGLPVFVSIAYDSEGLHP